MKFIIRFFGILILLAGLSLLVNHESIFSWLEDNLENPSLYILATVGILAIGIIFIKAANQSKFPGAIIFIGCLVLIAAVVFIFMGYERFQDFMSSLIPHIKPIASICGLLVMAVGGFVIYGIFRKQRMRIKII